MKVAKRVLLAGNGTINFERPMLAEAERWSYTIGDTSNRYIGII